TSRQEAHRSTSPPGKNRRLPALPRTASVLPPQNPRRGRPAGREATKGRRPAYLRRGRPPSTRRTPTPQWPVTWRRGPEPGRWPAGAHSSGPSFQLPRRHRRPERLRTPTRTLPPHGLGAAPSEAEPDRRERPRVATTNGFAPLRRPAGGAAQ